MARATEKRAKRKLARLFLLRSAIAIAVWLIEAMATTKSSQEDDIHSEVISVNGEEDELYSKVISIKEDENGNFKEAIISSDANLYEITDGNQKRFKWKVRIGDSVIVMQPTGAGSTLFGLSKKGEYRYYPFTCPWAAAQVLRIHKDGALHVRWYYRPREIPSSKAEGIRKRKNDLTVEEIFESDHVDTKDLNSGALMAPVEIVESGEDCDYRKKFRDGIPQVQFVCKRFWSTTRKSFIQRSDGLDQIRDRCYQYSGQGSPKKKAKRLLPGLAGVVQALSLSSPSSSKIVGRESERARIRGLLNTNVASILIAGAPGVGKTACVKSVLSEFRNTQVYMLNGMELRDPLESYVQLWSQMKGETLTSSKAQRRLQNHFLKGGLRQKTVVVLDEIDYLINKKQTVLYNFFDWPNQVDGLTVIGISNTLNLAERLHPRVQSRIGTRQIYFQSYKEHEIASILRSKLEDFPNAFDDDAIIFASKKTAALSGDLRKALAICRTAADALLNRNVKTEQVVQIRHIVQASRESSNSSQSKAVALCSPMQVLFLVAVSNLVKTSGKDSFELEDIIRKMEAMSNGLAEEMYMPPPSSSETLILLEGLVDSHLLVLKGSGNNLKVSAPVDEMAVLLALRGTEHAKLAQKYLAVATF